MVALAGMVPLPNDAHGLAIGMINSARPTGSLVNGAWHGDGGCPSAASQSRPLDHRPGDDGRTLWLG